LKTYVVAANSGLCEHSRAQNFVYTVAQATSKAITGQVAQQLSDSFISTASRVYQDNIRFVNRYGRWGLVAWLAALVDGKLLLAIALSGLTYRHFAAGYDVPWHRLEPAYQQLCVTLAKLGRSPLGVSSLAFLTTYGFAAAWSELGGHWAAITLLLLGVGNGLFLLREINTPPSRSPHPMPQTSAPPREADLPVSASPRDSTSEADWQDLTATDPLKRLLAVRALLHWCLSTEAGTETYLPGTAVTVRSHLIDCFRLMLTRESEPLVRVAILEGLKALQPRPQLAPGQPAIKPLGAHPMRATRPEKQRSVEYVEP